MKKLSIEILGQSGIWIEHMISSVKRFRSVKKALSWSVEQVANIVKTPGVSLERNFLTGTQASPQRIKKSWPQIKVLAFTLYETFSELYKMLDAGADGYVLKAIRATLAGEVYIPISRRAAYNTGRKIKKMAASDSR